MGGNNPELNGFGENTLTFTLTPTINCKSFMGEISQTHLDKYIMIANTDAFLAGVWNYDFINEELPNKVAVSDIDGVIERKGRFLFLETKATGASLPVGQRRMYEQLVALGIADVLFIYGDKDNPLYYQRLSKKGGELLLSVKTGIDRKNLAKLIKRWYKWADRNPTEYYKQSLQN